MRSELISVVMPVYNAERYLGEAIESILNQTYREFEFIMIDDGSTDNSLSIIKRYAEQDPRIVVLSRENRGLVSSLNEGIQMAKGNLIARMDADDISYPERFEKEVKLLERRPEVCLVGTNFRNIYCSDVTEETRKIKERFEKSVNEHVGETTWKRDIFEDYKILHPTWIIRKELFHKIGYYLDYCTEDVEFLFRTVCNDCAVAKVEEVLLDYRIMENSKSVNDAKTRKVKEEICEYKFSYVEKKIGNRLEHLEYAIWGADISGEILIKKMKREYPGARCRAVIDSYKSGELMGIPILTPDQYREDKVDYTFICTNGGKKAAISFLENMGRQLEKDYFKVV